MSIESGSIYESFTLYQDNDDPLWTIQGPLSGDTVAGLLVGINLLLDVMIYNYRNTNLDNFVEIVTEGGKALLTIPLALTAHYLAALTDYKLNDSSREEIISRTTYERPLDNSFGWWILNLLEDKYTLYTFITVDFIQGFISACNAFGVDFRDYILGLPFTYRKGIRDPIYYSIETYDIQPIPFPKKTAPVGAFYTATYEADPNGEDYI